MGIVDRFRIFILDLHLMNSNYYGRLSADSGSRFGRFEKSLGRKSEG
jgi:hypothetical protein